MSPPVQDGDAQSNLLTAGDASLLVRVTRYGSAVLSIREVRPHARDDGDEDTSCDAVEKFAGALA